MFNKLKNQNYDRKTKYFQINYTYDSIQYFQNMRSFFGFSVYEKYTRISGIKYPQNYIKGYC